MSIDQPQPLLQLQSARAPYRPPLLSLWARNDLADSVVAFARHQSVEAAGRRKAIRAAQPLVLFTAARRLKVLDRAQDAFRECCAR